MEDGLLGSRDPKWIQGGLNVLIGLFWRIVPMANIAKSKTMTCQMRVIRLVILEEVVGRKSTDKGTTYQ